MKAGIRWGEGKSRKKKPKAWITLVLKQDLQNLPENLKESKDIHRYFRKRSKKVEEWVEPRNFCEEI